MDLLRNPEIKKQMCFYILFSIVVVCGAAFMSSSFSGYVCIICVINGIAFWRFMMKRYDRIADLSNQLDQILHGNYAMDFTQDKEGELAILSSEIYKMTVQLREQAEALKKDKIYLRDSIADISHQLRTPLTSIRMVVPRLQRENLGLEERIALVWEVNSLLSRIEWLISALLKISQLESGTVSFMCEQVLVEDLVKKALEPLEIPMEVREQSVKIEIKNDTSYTGDFYWSVEAISNIIKNCMEHTQNGGRIHISAEENPVSTEIIITDNGSGIMPEDLPYLFDRFYKGKASGKESIGIGLALSRMIINRQNGTIKACNSKEGGAKFHIKFYKGAI